MFEEKRAVLTAKIQASQRRSQGHRKNLQSVQL